MVGDPIGDMLIRLKNASAARKPFALMPHSNAKEAVAKILQDEGYVKAFDAHAKDAGRRALSIELLTTLKGPAKINDVERLSKPGRRVYMGGSELRPARKGIIVVSTSGGLMTSREASKKKLGGEVMFSIW